MGNLNDQILADVGKRLRNRREELFYSQKDISNLTGLTVNTISSLENGRGTGLDNFLLICRALKIQPREVFPEVIPLDSLYDLPPNTRRRLDTTQRLDALVYKSDFFEEPRRVADVLRELDVEANASNHFSVYLSAYCKDGILESVKKGKVRHYFKKR